MARTAKAPAPHEVRWNRCKDDCGCNGTPDPRFCKCWATSKGKCGRDRRSNAQMRHYAMAVTANITGAPVDGFFICPLTGMTTPVSQGEVDKVDPRLGYVPTNVVMVSRRGNQSRANLQKGHRDILGWERYASDVAVASQGVEILPVSVAWTRASEVAGSMLAKGESNEADPYSREVMEGPYGAY